MTTAPFKRDQVNHDDARRRAALLHAITSLRSAATASLAARCGDSTSLRDALLTDLNRRIESMVRELRALE